MIQAITNNVIVQPKTKYVKHISDIAKRAALQNDSSINPADCVQIIGEVISLPKNISPFALYKGFSTKDIRVGDTAIFSYRVIFDMVEVPHGQDPIYKNILPYENKEYFLADIKHIFGVIRDRQIIMVNGWVMLTEIEQSKIIIPHGAKKAVQAAHSNIIHIGHSRTHLPGIKAIEGDEVFFKANHAQHYEINGKKFLILPQEKIFGRVGLVK